MAEFPDTRDSLIVQVQNSTNRAAWEEFEGLYRPVIFRIARAKGLQHADALDLVQQVLLSVAKAIGHFEKYDEEIRFRNWLSRITRNAILKALTRPRKDRAAGGSELLDVLSAVPAADPETDSLIDLEYRREIFRKAAVSAREGISESTWLAFEMTVLQEADIAATAEFLGMSVGSVYAARSRVIRRIETAVNRLKDE